MPSSNAAINEQHTVTVRKGRTTDIGCLAEPCRYGFRIPGEGYLAGWKAGWTSNEDTRLRGRKHVSFGRHGILFVANRRPLPNPSPKGRGAFKAPSFVGKGVGG